MTRLQKLSDRRSFSFAAIADVSLLPLLAAVLLATVCLLIVGVSDTQAHGGAEAAYNGAPVTGAPGSCEAQGLQSAGSSGLCTHGLDPLPPDATGAAAAPVFSAAADDEKAVCDGDGVSGSRIQVLYVHPIDQPNRFGEFESSFRVWAHNADLIYQANAANMGGVRYLRFVHGADCTISVLSVPIGSIAGSNPWNEVIYDLESQGYSSPTRHYLIFLDAALSGVCGMGTSKPDDSPGPANQNNTMTSYAVLYNTCWQYPEGISHEIGHTMGAVQSTAPHVSAFSHCTDEWEIMCYQDYPGLVMTYPCDISGSNTLLDCNRDDYFNLNPAPGSYLDTHWNIANNIFLGTGMKLTIDKVSSKYNGLVTAFLTSFTPGVSVALTFDGVLLSSFNVDGSGAATVTFRTPLAVFGNHTITATDSYGRTESAILRVIPRILLSATSGPSGSQTRVYFYGFASGEKVEIRWYSTDTKFTVLGTVTIASNGRGTKVVTIPAGSTIGSHKIVGKVIGVSRSASTTFNVTASTSAEDPTATATATATATSASTATPTAQPTMTPTATATAEPSATLTVVATMEPTATETEVATETPTLEPTATETPIATATPTATETAIIEPTATSSPEPTSTETPEAIQADLTQAWIGSWNT